MENNSNTLATSTQHRYWIIWRLTRHIALGGEMGKLKLKDLEEVDRQLDEYVSQCLYCVI